MKKKLLLCMSAALLVLLTACGIELNTNLSMDHDFQGSRIIDCTINKNDLTNINKDFDFLDETIKDNCPDAMSYKNLSEGNQIHYQFTISFSSYKDYKNKITKCLNFAPKINYYYGNSPFANGLLYNENFTSGDLMAWFSESLVKDGLISDSEVENIWSIKNTRFYFDGKEQSVNDQIDIDTLSYLPLDGIQIYTEELDSGKYRQTVVFQIPEETLNRNSKDIQKYLNEHLDANSYHCEWNPVDNGKEYLITFDANTMEQLNQMSTKVLKDDSSIHISSYVKDSKPFQMEKQYTQKISLSAFRSSADSKVNYQVYFKPAKNTSLSNRSNVDKNGFYQISKGNSSSISVYYNTSKQLTFESYKITTIYHSDKEFQRELCLNYKDSLSEEEQNLLQKYLQKCGFQIVSFQKKNRILLVLSGSPSKISSVYQRVFDGKNTLTSEIKKHNFNKSQKSQISDVIDLSNLSFETNATGTYYFISNSQESAKEASIFIDEKEQKLQKLNALEKGSVSDSSNLSNFKREYKSKIDNGTEIEFQYQGGVTDVYGSAATSIAIGVILIAVFILFFYRYRKTIQNIFKK